MAKLAIIPQLHNIDVEMIALIVFVYLFNHKVYKTSSIKDLDLPLSCQNEWDTSLTFPLKA